MTITLNIESIFAWIGTAACVIVPLIIALAVYANYGVYRKGQGGEKWK
jgi:hypothetical protein